MGSPSTTSPFPGFEALFKLSDPVADRPFRGRILTTSAEALAFKRGEIVPAHPILVEHAMGGAPSDFIWTTLAVPAIVSDRVVKLLRDAAVTGWALYPVCVVGKDSAEVRGYHGLAVLGRCGAIDPARSEFYLKPPPVPHGMACWHRRGLFFDPSSWDGSDVFSPSDGSGFIFVVDRVKRLFERAKVRNVKLQKLVEYEVLVPSAELAPSSGVEH